ncbi:MAG: hypothetical protein H3C28_00705 [Sphingomonadales bacterium]|nr:hypothetical protein [Sphingomonadales bacterium]
MAAAADSPDPVSGQARERRLILAFYEQWSALAADRPYPALTDFTAAMLAPYKPFAVLIDLRGGRDQPILRAIGGRIAARLGENLVGQALERAPRHSLLSRVTDHYLEVLANRAPVAFEATFHEALGEDIPYRAILAPLSDDGENIDFILGVVNWKVETDTAAQAIDLAADLTALRAAAKAAGRSRQALYILLGDALAFWGDAHRAPADYAALLREAGVKAQSRAPFTALLKLIFGAHYDKTRLTEYAAALAHAQRQGWAPQTFRERLLAEGGMKAMVRSERRRREPRAAKHPMLLAELAQGLPALAVVDRWPADKEGDQPLLLLARRGAGGRLEVVAATPADQGEGERLARRMVRQKRSSEE